eukprot:gb/GECG01006332.1/.p1 GENE.gb/GECG01006332.1/~~gb/GECG01006332.1/.p1  ORF type:complete len:311 (+),score=35.67 gb/GECG01006332.1/:1-933(+)
MYTYYKGKMSSSGDSLRLLFERNGKTWFAESETMWPGQQFCLEVKQVLYQGKSQFQDILIFESASYGKVLVLDGVIQISERDESAYQEMITHVPLFAHPNPKRVLVVGGGDGGVVREVCRHQDVEEIIMCEIDEEVVNLSKKYFAESIATSFDDPRLTLQHMDAAEYIANHEASFDVMIVDSSDPVGPAETLYTPQFYESARKCLRDDGVICTQGECMWLHLDMIYDVMRSTKSLFPVVDYAYTCIPTYPCGQIGFILASKTEHTLRTLKRSPENRLLEQLKYYSPEIHSAAFVLPKFVADRLDSVRGKQ